MPHQLDTLRRALVAAVGLVVVRRRRLALHLPIFPNPGRDFVADETQVGQ
jgi:hypothetical protein